MTIHKQLATEDMNLRARVLELKALAEQLDRIAGQASASQAGSEGVKDRLVQQAGDMLVYMTEHFVHEEEAMKEIFPVANSSTFLSHAEDHANLSEKALDLVVEITETSSGGLPASLAENLASNLETHFQRFDKNISS